MNLSLQWLSLPSNPKRSTLLSSISLGFPGSSAGKEPACNAGDPGSIPRLGKSPGERHGNPLQYSCLENPHGQRILVGYSPWGCKESDVTERPSTAQHTIQRKRSCHSFRANFLIFPEVESTMEKAMATHSSILAWKIPWTEEPGRLQSMGLLRVGMTERLHFHFSLSCIREGNGNPFQCSCLENPRDGGAWLAAVYGVTPSWTRLKWLSSSSSSRKYYPGISNCNFKKYHKNTKCYENLNMGEYF